MSLTEQLRDSGSPLRAYIDGISPRLEATAGNSRGARAVSRSLGLSVLAGSQCFVPPWPDSDRALIGTSFDIRTRIALGGFDAHLSTAAAGVLRLRLAAGEIENGEHRVRVLAEAFALAESLLQSPSDEAALDRAAVLFARCEQVYRAHDQVLRGAVGAELDVANDAQAFATNISPLVLSDVRALRESNAQQVDSWKTRVDLGESFDGNVSFRGSEMVGGADADWLIGDTLVECKVYTTLTLPKLRDFLRQLLGYVMLDLDDTFGIRRVGIWLPRQRLLPTWSLATLLSGDPDELLPTLRSGFVRALGGQQIAVHTPVTERRMHQLLADNRHTPFEMLEALAASEDADIRYRVARNPVSPEQMVRALAMDRLARVREGAATNERAPADVLESLAQDSSVGVRRAVAANPGAPNASRLALAADVALDVRWAARGSDEDQEVHIRQDRTEFATDERWLFDFLWSAQPGGFKSLRSLRLPEASEIWAAISDRDHGALRSLGQGLPIEVKANLMGAGRPAWVRRLIASQEPVEDAHVRSRLLADLDPEIRWSALDRSQHHPDQVIGELLGELAASRDERIRFRTEGSEDERDARRNHARYDKQMLELIAKHPSTPLPALRDMVEGASIEILRNLFDNPALDVDELGPVIVRLRATTTIAVREQLARSSKVPAELLESLASDRQRDVREAVAGNISAPCEALSRLALDRHLSVQLAVIENPATPDSLASSLLQSLLASRADDELGAILDAANSRPQMATSALIADALDRLSRSRLRNPDPREVAAADARTPHTALTRLAKSVEESIRCAVAKNPGSPIAVIEALMDDASPSVRAAVAGRDDIDESWLVLFAADDAASVRSVAASSTRLPGSLLAVLMFDDDIHVRTAASRNPTTPADEIQRAESEWKSRFRPTPSERSELEAMAADKRAKVRMQVAYRMDTPPDILALLGGERRSAAVRRVVAANPYSPAALLRSLADDDDVQVRQAVAFNGATPSDVLADLAGRSVDFALLVALNPDAAPEVVKALMVDGEPLVASVAKSVEAGRLMLEQSTGDAAPALEP